MQDFNYKNETENILTVTMPLTLDHKRIRLVFISNEGNYISHICRSKIKQNQESVLKITMANRSSVVGRVGERVGNAPCGCR